MKTPIVKGLSQKVVAYQPVLTRLTGKLSAGVLLSQILYWWGKRTSDTFYKTDKEFCQELGMGLEELRNAKRLLTDKGFISVVKKGIPQRSHYVLNVEFTETSLGQLPELNWVDNPNCDRSTTQTNSENTTESTTDTPTTVGTPPSGELPEVLGKQALHRLVRVYNYRFWDMYGFDYNVPNWPQMQRVFKPLLASYSEWQIAALILLHFDWRGTSGEDEFVYKRLSEKCFPLEWVPKALNEYRAYLQNTLGVDFDDHEAVKAHVVDIIKPLHKEYVNAHREDTVT